MHPLSRVISLVTGVCVLSAVTMPDAVQAREAGQSIGPGGGDPAPASLPQPLADTRSFKPPRFAANMFTYVHGAQYRNPFIASAMQPKGADIARNAIAFTHIDAWKYGHNFAEVIIKSSNAVEPAAGGGSGAMEFYSIFRSGVSINRIAGRPIIALGALHDIDIQAGADFQTKNTAFAPNERALYFGPNLQFLFGSGFLNVGLQLRKEWNHNGVLGKNERYDLGFNIEPVWNFPFRLGRAQFAVDGFADYNTPKGKDGSGQDTRAELLVHSQLKLDISSAVGLSSGVLGLGVGFEYWRNMFGKDAVKVPGARQFTPVVSLVVHWPPTGSAH